MMQTYQLWQPLLEVLAKSLIILLSAAALCWALRKAGLVSAAGRHLIWSFALAALLALPLLSRVVPTWRLPLLPAPTVETASLSLTDASVDETLATIPVTAPPVPMPSWVEYTSPATETSAWKPNATQVAIAVWLLGVAFVLGRLVLGAWRMRRITQDAERLTNYHWSMMANRLSVELALPAHVTLYLSEVVTVPVTWGVLRPVVILPLEANTWSREWQRIVLLHEFAHIKRRDCLMQMLASAACAIYWFNPLVWRAARQLRVERELACDDYVLAVGTRASDYASCLVGLASSFDLHNTPAIAVGMGCSELESRVRTMLDPAIERRWWSAPRQALAVVIAATLLLPLAALQAVSQNKLGEPVASEVAVQSQSGLASVIAEVLPSMFPIKSTDEQSRPAPAPVPVPNPQPVVAEAEEEKEDEADDVDIAEEVAVSVATKFDLKVNFNINQDAQAPGQKTSALTANDLVQLKMHDVTPEYIEAIKQAGFDATLRQIVQAKIHGITTAYIQEAQNLAGSKLALRDVIDMKVAGLTAAYVNEMKQAGLGQLSINQLTQMRHLGVTPDYLAELKRAGLENLSAHQITQLKALGITESYVRQAQSWGGGKLSVQEITRLKAINVTPADAQEFKALGFDNLSLSELTKLKTHGVTASFIQEMRALGFDKLTIEEALKFKIHGVTPDYVKKMRAAGFKNISSTELLKLKIQGLDSILLKQ